MTTQQDRSNVRIFPPLIQILAIAFSFVVQWAIPLRVLGISRRLTLFAGWVLILAAASVIAWTARLMFRAGTTPDPTRPGTVLVVDGPFRFTRNPMYLTLGTDIAGRPPAQIRTCGTTAYGSYLGCLASKRTFGCGCRILALGIHRPTNAKNRSQVIRSRWLRRRRARSRPAIHLDVVALWWRPHWHLL
jgi:protein-S-isoprenylcysteine O-methyltransferase Ste14